MEDAATISLHNWERLTKQIDEKGYAILPRFLSDKACDELINQWHNEALYRRTVEMARYRFGVGAYKYFRYPLPPLLQQIRRQVYPYLAPLANKWMGLLKTGRVFPVGFDDLQQQCNQNGQTQPAVLILKYGAGGHNTLHQDLYGEIFFPIQLVLFLNEPGHDYVGGEFVLTEQTPRAQSKAIVLQPKKGDMLLFTTNFRPVKGSKGYYRLNIKHGVSEVATGERHTVGVIFHDASS